MTDPYTFWRESLAGAKPAITNEDPKCGFYRMKRGGKFVPVAVFADSAGELRFKINDSMATNDVGIEQWPWYAANPITEEEYRRVAEQGQNWSDIDSVVADAIGAPSTDLLDDLRLQIDTAAFGARVYKTIEGDGQARQAQTLRALLQKLGKQADDARKVEKEPYLQAGRDVDAKWMPTVKLANDTAVIIRKAMERWEDSKLQAQSVPQSNMPPPAQQVKGAFGKAANVGTYQAVEIIDIDAVFGFFKTSPEVVDLLTKLAQRATDNEITVPGIKTETKSRIR